LKSKSIPHNIIVGVPRHISSIDDLILEAEIILMIEMKHKGKSYYMTTPDANTNFNDLGTSFQGTDVYAFSGLGYLNDPDRITLPVVDMMENRSEVKTNLVLSSNDIKKAQIHSVKNLYGAAKTYDQSLLMDVYAYVDEEKTHGLVADNAGMTYRPSGRT
jgi:hypothetical protein